MKLIDHIQYQKEEIKGKTSKFKNTVIEGEKRFGKITSFKFTFHY